MKKILFVHPVNDFTGSSIVLYNVIKSNYNNCHKMLLTTTYGAGGPFTDLDKIKIYNIKYPLFRGKKIPIMSSLLSIIDGVIKMSYLCFNVDIVYINTIVPFYAAIIAKLLRKEIIWHIHEKYAIRSFPVKLIEYVQSHTNAHFIFVSNYLMHQYRLSKKSTFEVKYNKLDAVFIKKIKVIPIKDRLKSRIVMLCSYTKAKGIYTFVEVAKLLPQYEFTLVLSTDPLTVDKFSKETHTPSNCKVLPVQTNVNDIYKENDLVLNLTIPSLCIETFGMTIIEAFAYGLPVIVPNVGGPAEIVKDMYNGRIVDVDNALVVKNTICEILSERNYENYAMHALHTSKLFI